MSVTTDRARGVGKLKWWHMEAARGEVTSSNCLVPGLDDELSEGAVAPHLPQHSMGGNTSR